MSTEVDGKPADPPLNGSASSYSGVSPLRSLRQMFPKTLSDKYRLGEELGRGAYGHVFRGLDTRTGQHVAIKQIGLERIPPGGLAGIIREVDLLKTLHHPNVVKYLGSLRTSTHLYIVLEFVENGALSSIIKSSSFGPFPESLVAIYVQQVLQGLAYLHTQGVVHRDIKGANILTTKEGIVKLADFGVAAQLSDLDASRPAGASLRSSGSSSPVGTAYWMAPEVVEMGGVTTAADIWSVGCLAVELFTGVPPYYDLQPMSALYNIVADPHPPLPKNISAAMRDFLLRCFAKDPKKRPSAAELLEHAWLTYNRRTLRGTWSRTRGTRSTHTSVALVVERMLAADAAEGGTVKGTEESPSSRDSTAPPMAIKEASVAAEGSSSAQLEKRSSAIKDEPTTTSASSLVVSLDFADEDLTGLHLLEHLRSQGTALALSPRTLHIDDELAEAQHTELLRAVAKQVSALQVVRFGAQRDVVKEAGAAASCAALASLLRGDDADRVRLVARSFVAQQGLPALRDLLDASSERLLDRAMDLVLCLLGPGPAGDACLSPALAAGLIPAVLRFARPVHPHALRVVAAHIAEALSRTAQGTSTLLSADQLPALLDLLLGDGQSHGSSNNNVTTAPLSLDLLQAALDCCWRLVLRAAADAPGMPSVNEIFRALARAGLAERMTAVLPAVLQAYRARASAGPVAGGLGMVRAAHARSASVPLTETELALLVPTSSGADARGGAVPGHPQPSSSMNIAAQTSSTNGAETTTPLHLHGAIIPPPPLPNKLTVVGHGRPSTGATQPAIDETPSSSPRGHTASHFGSRSSATTMGDMSSSVHHHGGLPQGPRSPIRRLPPGRVVSQGTEPESSDVLLQSTLSYPSGARTAAEQHHANSSSPLPLLDGILNLYASMVYGDALVKAALVTRPVLGPLFSITAALPAPLALTVVGAVRALTADRDMHEALTNASGIAFLVAQLARPNEPLLQDQALSALHSLTADDLARQEQAAVAGTVPFLCQLGILPQRGAVAAHAHALAVSLLCALARGSARSRAELWAHDALSVFLHLLKDETCQVEVLGALASWLEADTTRVENRLATGDALTRIVTLIPVMSATAGENEALCGVLAPLHHLLSVSPRLARELASNGLMPRVLELLRRRTAITTVPALDVLAAMVGAHPQPKALAARFRLVPLLLPLAQSQVTDGVQRKATVLLQTLREG